MMHERLRLALVGASQWGLLVGDALVKDERAVLAVCCDVDRSRAEAAAERFGARAVTSLDEVLVDASVAAVVNVGPTHLHAHFCRQIASAGKHIFVSKPLATSLSEARDVAAACADAQVLLMVGHNDRRRPGHRKTKELVENEALGTVIMAEAHNSHPGGTHLRPDDWRWQEKSCPTGSFLQLAVHCVDTLQYLLGPIEKVSAAANKLFLQAEIPDAVLAVVQFHTGVLGYIGSSYVVPATRYLNVYGTRANAFCDRGETVTLRYAPGDTDPKRLEVKQNDYLAEEMSEFVDCIIDNKEPETGVEEALAAQAVVDAVRTSIETGKLVTIDHSVEGWLKWT